MSLVSCQYCNSGLKLYPSGTHNVAHGTWARCTAVDAERQENETGEWKFRKVCLSERAAKSELTKYRNRGMAAGWSIHRGWTKFWAIFTAPLAV